MNTSKATSWDSKLRISLACLAITALTSLNLWTGNYCLRNHAQTVSQPSSPPQAWHGSGPGYNRFFSF